MPYYNQSQRNAMAGAQLGIKVERDTSTLPQTAAAAIFTIAGGKVLLTGLLGEVTTLLGAVGNLSVESNPTTGTTSALCAVVAAGAKEAGTLISITGTVGDAMLADDAGGVKFGPASGVVLPIGTLEQRTSASDTGAIAWTAWYIPL